MENNKFDKDIRKKLKDLEAEFNPGDWNAFEERLNLESQPATEPEIDDIYFDGVIYDKLSKLEEEYDPKHWSIMANRLDEAFSLRNKILRYKVLELALVFLAIFTFLQLFPVSTPSENNQAQTNDAPNTALQLVQIPETTTPQSTKQDHSITEIKAQETIVEAAVANNTTSVTNTTSIERETATTAIETVEKPVLAIGLRDVQDVLSPTSKVSVFKPVPVISLYSVKQTEYSAKAPAIALNDFSHQTSANHFTEEPNSIEDKATLQNTDAQNKLKNLDLVHPIANASISSLAFDEEAMQEKDLPYQLANLKQTGIRFGMFSTLDYNYVLTPYDVLFEREAQTRTAIGYGAGFSISFQFNGFELETGSAYSIKKYAPEFREFIGRTNQDTPEKNLEILVDELKDIELNVLNIPLNLRYTYGKYGKWRASVVAGASLNMALQASYDRKQTFNGSDIYRKRENFERFKENLDQSLALDNKKYPDGLLEGGNFMENSYFTANLGLGLERILSPRWSLFFQPSYHHFIQVSEERLGPNKDRINTFSISAGAKVNLK